MEKTKVVLVNPRCGEIQSGMPLSLASLKSNVDNCSYDIKVIDCSLNDIDPESSLFADIIRQINPEVVGVTSYSFNYLEALSIFKIIKEIDRTVVTIYGGPHATTYYTKTMENREIDFLFRGEAELSFSLFLNELKKDCPDFSGIRGLVYRNEKGGIVNSEISIIDNLDEIKFPDYESINLDLYNERGYYYRNGKGKSAPIMATRGCPYLCKFCSAPTLNGRKIRKFSLKYMIDLINLLYREYDVKNFNMIDDNFTYYPEYAKAFCREVLKLGYKDIRFDSTNGVRMQRGDVELWSLMWDAGWRYVSVAPESGSERVLRSMGKNFDPQEVPAIVRDIKKTGIKVHGYVIVGYPGETVEDLKKTEFLVRKCKFDGLSAFAFQPIPGTPIYDELIAKKEISDNLLPTKYENHVDLPYLSPALKGFDMSGFAVKLEIILYLVNPKLILKRIFCRSNPVKFFTVSLRNLPMIISLIFKTVFNKIRESVGSSYKCNSKQS